jgi:hypothetical protein
MSRLALLIVVLAPAVASAHIALTYPPVRTTELKVGPCGAAGSVRGKQVTVLAPGAMLEVRWNEPINHPSHYRIAFDADGQDFPVPSDFMDFSHTDNVLADNIPDGASPFSMMVKLPDVACETCTLQLTQMMYDKPPYGDGNDIYYQCADIALRPGGSAAPGPDGGSTTEDPQTSDEVTGGCSIAGDTPATQGLWITSLLGLLVRRRRR